MPNQSDPNQNSPVIPTVPIAADLPPLPPEFQKVTTETQSKPDQNTSGSAAPVNPTPPNFSPIVSGSPKKKFGGGRIIATILGILLLVGGIGGGVFLTQQQQDIREKADIFEEEPGDYSSYEEPEEEEEEEEEDDSGGGGAQTGPVGGQSGTCVDVDCSITLDSNGTYHYDPSQDDNYENLDGGPVEGGEEDDSNYYSYLVESTQDNDCTGDGICSSGSCVNNACITSNLSCKVGDPNAPGCCANLNPADCDNVVCEPGPVGPRQECRLPSGQHCTLAVGVAECGGANEVDEPEGTPPSTSIVASCLNVKAYNSDWVELTTAQLPNLVPGNTVNFCVKGSATSGIFDKAQFSVAGSILPETTTQHPTITSDFCQSYTIKPTDITVNVNARIHHVGLNQWFGETL